MKKTKMARKPKIPTERDMLQEEIANELGFSAKTGSGGFSGAGTGFFGGILSNQARTRMGDGKEDE